MTERDWKKFGYVIIERINSAPTVEKVDELVALHRENIEGYRAWNPEKHAQLLELVAAKREELAKEKLHGDQN